DVDGVLTTGALLYSAEGKAYKVFGPDDHDALSLVRRRLEVFCVTGDKSGFEISRKRVVDHMKLPLELVSTSQRVAWIEQRWPLQDVIYMGDGIFDSYVFKAVRYDIAPANADETCKAYAHYVTRRSGGDRAVAEACLHILERFFEP